MKNKAYNELVMVNSQEQEPGDISNLSFEEQDKLRSSWIQLEALLANFQKLSNKETNVLKVENTNIESVRESSQEIYDFYTKFFSGEENADPKQIEIGIASNIVDTYIGRGADGKIASILQSQRVEIPATEMGGRPELMHLIWYVATDKNYQGPRLTPDLFRLAMADILNQSKNELKPIKAFVGETEDEVEGLFNRYGLERVYLKNKNGNTMEVPYECPPEDESAVGVPEHLMIRNLNGNKTMDKDEYMKIVDGIYQQYTRPEYFSVEYLQYAQEYYKDSLNIVERNIPINEKKAKKYRQNYLDIVDKIRIKLQNELNQSDGSLFMKSRNQRQLEEQAGGPDNLVEKVA